MSEKISEAQKKALKKYRANVKRFTVDFPPTDAELWEHVQQQPNKQRYLKELIRADMDKEANTSSVAKSLYDKRKKCVENSNYMGNPKPDRIGRADMGKPKGHWAIIGENCCVCSVCHNHSIQDYSFCPECGAEMERGGEHG